MTMLHGNSNESCHFILLVCKALHVKIAICTTRLVGKGSLLLQTVLKINQMLSLKCSYLKKKCWQKSKQDFLLCQTLFLDE